jgi:(1->4)-alpha-D-glucan 1-alpha-D-glucosylmutase
MSSGLDSTTADFAVNTLAGRRGTPWVGLDESQRGDQLDHRGRRTTGKWTTSRRSRRPSAGYPDARGGHRRRLRAVEKTRGDEQLPTSWATSGTTGYDALADVARGPGAGRSAGRAWLSTPPPGLHPPARLRSSWSPGAAPIHSTKRSIARWHPAPEGKGGPERDFWDCGTTAQREGTADALAELLACFLRSTAPTPAARYRAPARGRETGCKEYHRPEASPATGRRPASDAPA